MDLARFQDDHTLDLVNEDSWVSRGVYILHADWHIHARFARHAVTMEAPMPEHRLVYSRRNVHVPKFVPPPNLPTSATCTLRRCTAAALDTLAQCEHQLSLVRSSPGYPLTEVAFVVAADYQCVHVLGIRLGETASCSLGHYPLLPPFIRSAMHMVFDITAFEHLVHVAKQLADMGQVDDGSVLVLGLGATGHMGAQEVYVQTVAIVTEAKGPVPRCELVQTHMGGGD